MRHRMLLLAAVAVLIAAPAMAFHDDGVGYCQGCHTMHNSQNGEPMKINATDTGFEGPVGVGYADLLLAPNPTDTCLNCHARDGGYGVWATSMTAISTGDYTSAGNFVFLQEDNINDGRGGGTPSNFIPGEQSGHNLRSGIKGTTWDSVLDAPPGGDLTTNQIECTSCHDPHGQDSFRILYQQGQTVDVAGQPVTFAGTMVADAISYSASEAYNLHNAYKSGYSEWCSTCHGDFHNGTSQASPFIHPSGTELTQTIIDKYNAYKGTKDCVLNPPTGGQPCGSGSSQTAYNPIVPFESLTGVTTTSTDGPAPGAKVACVSCHRAHASSARDAGRWDFQILFMETDGNTSLSYKLPYANALNMPADDDQRSLCNKCHSQDEYDHLVTP